MKIKLFVARETQHFELGIFTFNSYVYHLTSGFIASTRAFNLATRAFSLLIRGIELVTRGGFELITCNSCFTFPRSFRSQDFSIFVLPLPSCSVTT